MDVAPREAKARAPQPRREKIKSKTRSHQSHPPPPPTGSLEEGKDADFVVWDGPPLSIYSKVQETWIEGTRYWSVDENELLEERDKTLRQDLIQKILTSNSSPIGKEMKPNSENPKHGHNCGLSDDELFGWELQ